MGYNVVVPDEPTQVMSLDELMTLAAEPCADTRADTRSDAITTPIPAPLDPATTARPTAAKRPTAAQPDVRAQIAADARRVYSAALAHGRTWLKTGDNALITATVAAALLLLLVVTVV